MIRVRHILCPVDFSDMSRHALDHAVAFARWYKARVTVLHAHQIAMPNLGMPYVGPTSLEPFVLTETDRRELLDRLDEYVAADRASSGVDIETVIDEAVSAPAAILQHASTDNADLIVIGTHGRSGFDRFVLGSVAEKVLRKSCCPVLTVPPHIPEAVPRRLDAMERIVCGIDFSASSLRALEYASSLAAQSGARVTVLHVLDVPPAGADLSGLAGFRAALFNDAHHRLDEAITIAVPQGVPTDSLLLAGKSYRELLRVAGEQDANLIVLGVQGHGIIDRAFFGSTADHVVREAACPVLTLRARP